MYHFYIKERMFSFKDHFQVFNDDGKEVYRVEGSFFSFGDELKLTDLDGRTLASIDQKLMSLVPRYEISVSGKPVCEVRKKLTFFKPKFEISHLGWEITGDLWGQNFQITDGMADRMTVNKKWLSWGDSYHLQITNEEDIFLCLAIAIVIDMVLFEDEN
ncbi:LURP-one-related family protein [Pseudomonas sp. ISL-88]|uniref:LURP-one-related/scramblase family protein n=1 Tax=Bacteria TaxID=2 RepID=UPI001BE75DC1|nr:MULTISPECIES: LURP-one-related family protein [Bacteria]MBT2634118.1 LURP-one-related family protein [Bacillus sp. ISL-26]MBT2713686.1 LURP-one-related family protein [Pseudomonas sp. ISL-88]